ncbi:MAG: hypothetical protein ABSD43_14705 [Terracidiphilus sp.]|jgi:hypothetical protein
MGLLVWLDLEPVDGGALFVCDILGLMAGWLLWPHMFLAFTAYIFVSYHLFLAWLLMTSDRKVGLSSHIVSTAFTHLACFVLACLCILLAISIHGSLALWLFIRPIRYCLFVCIPGLAVFERGWLFSGRGMKRQEETPVTVVDPAIAAVHAAATGDDYEAWQRHLASRNPLSRKPGTTLKDEYEQFMVARVKARAAAPATNNPA